MARDRPVHVLLVEDEPSVLTVLTSMLEEAGFRVTGARTAREAAELVRDETDVVVTDVDLNGESGLGLLAALRRRSPPLSVVVITADPTLEGATQARNLGASAYIAKPVHALIFLQAIKQAVARRDPP